MLRSFFTAQFAAALLLSPLAAVAASSSIDPSSEARAYFTIKTIASSDLAVSNQKNINLLRFDAKGASGVTLVVKKLIFTAQTGNAPSVQNYALWIDTNADGTVDTVVKKGVAPQGGKITFKDFPKGAVTIPAGTSTVAEVHADVVPSLGANTQQLQLKFDTSSTSYIVAGDDNGRTFNGISTNGVCASTCQIAVSATNSTLWTLVKQGDLFVSKDTVSLRSRQLLGGMMGDEVLRLNLRAEKEDVDVTYFQFHTWDSLGTSIDHLELYRQGETTAFATATVGGCGSDNVLVANPTNGKAIRTFCARMESQQLIVAKGTDTDVLVKPRMKTDLNGAISGESIKLWMSKQGASDSSAESRAVHARGVVSSNTLSANNGNTTADGEVFVGLTAPAAMNNDIVGNPNQVVLAKVISIANVNPDADGTAIPLGNHRAIGQFKLQASANSNSKNGLNKVDLYGIIFTINATNVDIDGGSFKLYNKADSTVKAPCVIVGSQSNSGSLNVRCMNMSANGVVTTTDGASSTTFVLEATVSNSKVVMDTDSTLQVSIDNFSDINNPSFGVIGSHFVWFDRDATSSTMFVWVESAETAVLSTLYQN